METDIIDAVYTKLKQKNSGIFEKDFLKQGNVGNIFYKIVRNGFICYTDTLIIFQMISDAINNIKSNPEIEAYFNSEEKRKLKQLNTTMQKIFVHCNQIIILLKDAITVLK